MGIFDPQGLSSSPSTQSVATSGINAWAQPYVFNYLNQGNALLNQGPNAAQQQVWNAAQNMQTPGQFGQGSGLLNQAGQGQLGTANQALAYGAQASGAGQNYQNMATNPAAVGAYMNPFIQQALAPDLALLGQQQALEAQNINARAAGQGAFGGNRATLAQGLNAQNYDLARQKAIGSAYSDAFKQAQQAQQYGAGLGLQGLQTALQGVQGAQQGYSGATQAGVGLGNIGAQQSQSDVARLGLQNQIANQQYNLPYQRLNFMQGLMSGLPVTASTTTGYQAGQNPWLQGIGALGTLGTYAPGLISAGKSAWDWATKGNTIQPDVGQAAETASSFYGPTYDAAAGWSIATGGQIKDGGVKRFASGGIASINRKVINDPTSNSADTINQSAQNNVLGGVTKLLALDEIAKQKQALQNQQVMQQQPKPPVYQQLAQAAGMGIDNAESNLPQTYAGGGIIAFNEGGDPPKSAFKEDIDKAQQWLTKQFGYSNPEPLPQWMRNIGSYFTRPRQEVASPGDADVQQGGFYGGAAPDQVTPSKSPNDIVIHPNAPKGPGGPAAPSVPMQQSRVDSGSGIDALTKRYEDMIRGGEDFKESEKRAETTGLRNLFLNMMNPERGASFVAGLGGAGQKAQAGYEKDLEGIQARKDKQISQLVGLGLKGQDLKNELQKLGITEEYYRAHYPLLAAQANYYNRSQGKGTGGSGKLNPTAYKIFQDYKAYAARPQDAPFFNQLPQPVRDGLTKYPPGSTSYNNAMKEFNRILQQNLANDVGMVRAIGSGSDLELD